MKPCKLTKKEWDYIIGVLNDYGYEPDVIALINKIIKQIGD